MSVIRRIIVLKCKGVLEANSIDILLLIAGNRTQVLDLVQLIDVTVNELIVLIRLVLPDTTF